MTHPFQNEHHNYNIDINEDSQGLIGYWKFNEGEGNILYDHSGNGNHGIIHGATWAGCTDPFAENFLENAEFDDGTCKNDEIIGSVGNL